MVDEAKRPKLAIGKIALGSRSNNANLPPTSRPVVVNTQAIGAIPTARPVSHAPQVLPVTGSSVKRSTAPAFSISLPAKSGAASHDSAPITEPSSVARQADSTSSTHSIGPAKPAHTKRSAAGTTWEDPSLADWDPNDFRIFVGDLAPEVNDSTLHQAFVRFGSISKARVVRDHRSGKSKGYGFVGFKEPNDYLRAMKEMNGKYIGSRPVKLKRSSWTDRCAK